MHRHFVLAALAALCPALAFAADLGPPRPPAEPRPEVRDDEGWWPRPSCVSERTLSAILQDFNWVQHSTFESALRMVRISDARIYAYADDKPAFHDRYYCQGTAHLSNGQTAPLYYRLNYDGWPPLGNRMQWCVVGYDYFRAYAPGCRQLMPMP